MAEAAGTSRRRLLLASNRGPVGFRVADGGELVARRGGGGLVTALGGLSGHHDVTWVAHAMNAGDVAASDAADGGSFEEVSRAGSRYRLRFAGKPDESYELYYNTMSNPLLWFLQHRLFGFGWDPNIDRRTHTAYRAYQQVNERLATALHEEAERLHAIEGDAPLVMVHDYQLFLVPGMVRRLQPELFLHFFLHIPWPEPGAWRCLPRRWVRDITESLLACDIVGMQTGRDVASFLRTCELFLGADIDLVTGTARFMGHVTRVRAYPISVAVDEFEEHVHSQTVQRLRTRINAMRPADDGVLIVRVDRTDPSKNIVRGFRAYGLMLHEHPELHQRVTMFCQLDPSRQDIVAYSRYLTEIERAAEDVNVAYGTGSWQPLFVNIDSNFQAAVAAYTEYDVLFVNPVADGMNLVSKEGPLVNTRNGAVVLSEQAGSYNELGPYVIGVNPFDIAQQADALYEAVTMGPDQRAARARMLREQVVTHDVHRWIDEQLADIEQLRMTGTLRPQ